MYPKTDHVCNCHGELKATLPEHNLSTSKKDHCLEVIVKTENVPWVIRMIMIKSKQLKWMIFNAHKCVVRGLLKGMTEAEMLPVHVWAKPAKLNSGALCARRFLHVSRNTS